MLSADYYADRVLDKIGINSIQDLQSLDLIAWERGAMVRYIPLTGAEARLTAVGVRAVISISTLVTDPRRRRFGVAHELGHLEMHPRESPLALCTKDDINDQGSKSRSPQREQQANEFASALLLPERFFAPACREHEPSLDLISDLADQFDVSLTATSLRFLHFTREPCAVVFSRKGFVRWFQANRPFEDLGLFVDVRAKLDETSLAGELTHGKGGQKTKKRVSPDTWLTSKRYRRGATILEHSKPMPS